MDKRPPSVGLSILRDVFPAQVIEHRNLQGRNQNADWQIEDELSISGIEGHTWLDISSEQARGTWDILYLIVPECMPIIFPGYLQWLWDPDEADVMASGLPNLLVNMLDHQSQLFSLEQLEGISRFLSACLDHTRRLLDEEDAELYVAAIRTVNKVAGRGGFNQSLPYRSGRETS